MNKQYHVIFPINKEAKIVIPLKDPIEWLGPIYQENILLLHKNEKHFLSNKPIYFDMMDLADLLKKALNNELLLDKSIILDIGFVAHQYHIDKTQTVQSVFPSGVISWIGYKYDLWYANHNNTCVMSWLYNNPDGSIVFEVTPFYPYMYCEPEEEPDYIPFEEWIKNYKPYFITTLSREIAEEWLAQAEQIIRIVEYNQKRWDLRSKEDVDS